MKPKRWTKIVRSKQKFPTRVIREPTKQYLQIGSALAAADIRASTGYDVSGLRTAHTRSQWRWCWALGKRLKDVVLGN